MSHMEPFSQPPKWIFLDLDGTLWDHPAASKRAIAMVGERYGIPPMTLHPVFVEANTLLWEDLAKGRIDFPMLNVRRFELALDRASGGCCSFDAQEVSEFYIENYIGQRSPLPGAEEALRHAASVAPLALLTNGERRTQTRKLAHFGGAGDLLSFVLCAGDVPAVKPQDEFFEEAVRQAGNPPRESVWMVGDSWEEDVVRGEAFGFQAVWLSHGRPLPDPPNSRIRVIEDIRGLRGLLDAAAGQDSGAGSGPGV